MVVEGTLTNQKIHTRLNRHPQRHLHDTCWLRLLVR